MNPGDRIEFLFHYFNGYARKASVMTGAIEVVLADDYALVRADTGAGYDVKRDSEGVWHHGGGGS